MRVGADREATFDQGNGALHMAIDYQVFATIYLAADLDRLAYNGGGAVTCIHLVSPCGRRSFSARTIRKEQRQPQPAKQVRSEARPSDVNWKVLPCISLR